MVVYGAKDCVEVDCVVVVLPRLQLIAHRWTVMVRVLRWFRLRCGVLCGGNDTVNCAAVNCVMVYSAVVHCVTVFCAANG